MGIKERLSWGNILVISGALALFFLWGFPKIFPVDTMPEKGLSHMAGERTWAWYVCIPAAFSACISMIISAVKYGEEEEEE